MQGWQSGQLRFSHKEVPVGFVGSNPTPCTQGNLQQVFFVEEWFTRSTVN